MVRVTNRAQNYIFVLNGHKTKKPKEWQTVWIFNEVAHPKNVGRMANSVDPDQIVRSGSALFFLKI